MPRGVLVVVAVGLLASLAAWLLTTERGEGEAAHLEFVKTGPIADSKPTTVPGGGGSMQLTEGRIQATGTNISGYTLFRVRSTLVIDKGAPVGGGRVVCSTRTHHPTEIAQTSGGLRATYPRSSEDGIWGQQVPETVLIDFSSHGGELAVLEVGDLKQSRFTTIQGVKLEWPEYTVGDERLKYFLPDGRPATQVQLPFYTVWKTQQVPAAKISCTLETSAGTATTATAGALPSLPPPIDEEAEAEKQEEREEGEGEGEEG
jgi:hypothetical protein